MKRVLWKAAKGGFPQSSFEVMPASHHFFDSLKRKKASKRLHRRDCGIELAYTGYSNLFSALTLLLNFFHRAFGNKLKVSTKSTGIVFLDKLFLLFMRFFVFFFVCSCQTAVKF